MPSQHRLAKPLTSESTAEQSQSNCKKEFSPKRMRLVDQRSAANDDRRVRGHIEPGRISLVNSRRTILSSSLFVRNEPANSMIDSTASDIAISYEESITFSF